MVLSRALRPDRRRIGRAAAALGLVACAGCTASPESAPSAPAAEPRPVLFRIALGGKAGLVLDPDMTGQIEVRREAADPVTLGFRNDAAASGALPPGAYVLDRLGPLRCEGIGFAVDDGAGPLALGTLRATVVETDYVIALPAPAQAEPAPAGAVPARSPIRPARRALCHSGPPPDETAAIATSPAGEVLLGLTWIGLCALAVAAGGICYF